MDISEWSNIISCDIERLDCAKSRILDDCSRNNKVNNTKLEEEEELPLNIYHQWIKDFQI